MRFWLWVGILAGLITMDIGREWREGREGRAWREAYVPSSTKSGMVRVMDDPGPKPTPRP